MDWYRWVRQAQIDDPFAFAEPVEAPSQPFKGPGPASPMFPQKGPEAHKGPSQTEVDRSQAVTEILNMLGKGVPTEKLQFLRNQMKAPEFWDSVGPWPATPVAPSTEDPTAVAPAPLVTGRPETEAPVASESVPSAPFDRPLPPGASHLPEALKGVPPARQVGAPPTRQERTEEGRPPEMREWMRRRPHR